MSGYLGLSAYFASFDFQRKWELETILFHSFQACAGDARSIRRRAFLRSDGKGHGEFELDEDIPRRSANTVSFLKQFEGPEVLTAGS
jgi:hypothetical protein